MAHAAPAAASDAQAAATPAAAAAGVPRDVRYPVQVDVDATGSVTGVNSHGAVPDSLLAIVERAARQATFDPARRNGVAAPARTWVTVRVAFQADGPRFSARVVDVTAGGGLDLRLAPKTETIMRTRARGYSAIVWTNLEFDGQGRVNRRNSGVDRVDVQPDPGVRVLEHLRSALAKRFRSRVEGSLPEWRWSPDEVDGQPVGGRFVVPVHFPSGRAQVARVTGPDTSPDMTFTPIDRADLRAARLQPWRSTAR